VFLNFAWTVYTGFQLETIQAFFETIAALAILEALAGDTLLDATTAGLASGRGGDDQTSGIGIGLAFAVALFLQRKKSAASSACSVHLMMFCLGAAVPILVTATYTYASGA